MKHLVSGLVATVARIAGVNNKPPSFPAYHPANCLEHLGAHGDRIDQFKLDFGLPADAVVVPGIAVNARNQAVAIVAVITDAGVEIIDVHERYAQIAQEWQQTKLAEPTLEQKITSFDKQWTHDEVGLREPRQAIDPAFHAGALPETGVVIAHWKAPPLASIVDQTITHAGGEDQDGHGYEEGGVPDLVEPYAPSVQYRGISQLVSA